MTEHEIPIISPRNGFSVTAAGSDGVGVLGSAFGGASYGQLGDGAVGVHAVSGAGSRQPNATAAAGVWGDCDTGNGVYGSSAEWNGVEGDTWSGAHAGVSAINHAGGPGLWASSAGYAGHFQGKVEVTESLIVGKTLTVDGTLSGSEAAFSASLNIGGDVAVTGTLTADTDIVLGADCAEEFDVVSVIDAEPGTVMALNRHGTLEPSRRAYDKLVAGVISGAGGYKPGLILAQAKSSGNRALVALVGKVYCKVSARYGSIEIGDLLTTSPIIGHAMKASDQSQAFGAVIGKALRPLERGDGMIPILVALQ